MADMCNNQGDFYHKQSTMTKKPYYATAINYHDHTDSDTKHCDNLEVNLFPQDSWTYRVLFLLHILDLRHSYHHHLPEHAMDGHLLKKWREYAQALCLLAKSARNIPHHISGLYSTDTYRGGCRWHHEAATGVSHC